MDLADVYGIFHPTSAQYIFFSVVYGAFSKVLHILEHKTSLSKYKKTEIIPCILSDHNALKLELNNKNNNRKYAYNWKLNNTSLTVKAVLRGKFIAMSAYIKRTEGSQINDLMLYLKLLEKQKHAKPKTSTREREI
jgi:hypothetical protein